MFGRPEGASVCECERVQTSSLAQSLYLMNGQDVRQKLGVSGGRAERLTQDKRPVHEKITELYLAAYSRQPSDQEMNAATAYLEKPRVDGQEKPLDSQKAEREAYEDILWAIINTKEFLYNH